MTQGNPNAINPKSAATVTTKAASSVTVKNNTNSMNKQAQADRNSTQTPCGMS
jgi:hypothetical protein